MVRDRQWLAEMQDRAYDDKSSDVKFNSPEFNSKLFEVFVTIMSVYK